LPVGEDDVEFLVNDLSLHGQFLDLTSFRGAIATVMAIRQISRRFGRELYCHRRLAQAQVTASVTMPQAVQVLTPDQRRALLQWLTRYGPFWEDARNHGPDDWLEWNGNIVTETSIGEAAWCCLNGVERGLVSFVPSDWQFSPVPVVWMLDSSNRRTVEVMNHWDPVAIEAFLLTLPVPLVSWNQLELSARTRCPELTFSGDAFAPLNGHPFIASAAQRLLFILDTLNRFKSCFDEDGQRTPEGHEIYRDFFTGRNEDGGRGPLFSDSSESEKRDFETDMTFKHPADPGRTLFCSWHGKVQTPQLRVHFSWPVRADEPLYVVYVGPKITRR
jgi:hypothetical protein